MTSSIGKPTNITVSAIDVNGCPLKPKPKMHKKMVKLRSVGRIIGCWDYAYTTEGEMFFVPPKDLNKLEPALYANLNVYLRLLDNYSDIAVDVLEKMSNYYFVK